MTQQLFEGTYTFPKAYGTLSIGFAFPFHKQLTFLGAYECVTRTHTLRQRPPQKQELSPSLSIKGTRSFPLLLLDDSTTQPTWTHSHSINRRHFRSCVPRANIAKNRKQKTASLKKTCLFIARLEAPENVSLKGCLPLLNKPTTFAARPYL